MLIAKAKKSHTVGEELVKPAALLMIRRILGEEAEKKLARMLLSNSTVQRRITDMSEIKAQLVRDIKDGLFGLFAIQLDESTDVASFSQLIRFVRCATHNSIKESMLFCEPFETATKAIDVKKKVSVFFKTEGMS